MDIVNLAPNLLHFIVVIQLAIAKLDDSGGLALCHDNCSRYSHGSLEPHVSLLQVYAPNVPAKVTVHDQPTDCDHDWGSYGQGSLMSTKHILHPRQDLNFTGYREDHELGLQGLFVAPHLNFAFCTIEKNACSSWNRIFSNMLMSDSRLDSSKAHLELYHTTLASQALNGQKDIENVFSNPQATRAVFVRDPLARFASAFIDKCLVAAPSSVLCPPHRIGMVFRDVVEWALKSDMANGVDGHWQLQSEHCQLRDRLLGYTVLGLMQKDSLGKDAACLLSKAKLEHFNTVGSDKGPVFSPHAVVHHQKMGQLDMNDEDILQKLFTPATARSLIEHLHQDYEVFGFTKEPAWIEGATGEWYDKVVSFEFKRDRKSVV